MVACAQRRKLMRGGTVKALPVQRGGKPWRVEAQESYVLAEV
jgi:hypothetical protein